MNEIICSEAIFFVLDSIDLHCKQTILDDIRIKLQEADQLHPDTLAGIKALQGVIEAHELMKVVK